MLGLSSVSVRDPSSGQVVGRELDLDLVAREDADVVLAHLPGDRGQDRLVHPVDLYPEHRARERLDDLALHLDFLFFLRHLPHRNRARRARLGTRKNTALAAGVNGSKRQMAEGPGLQGPRRGLAWLSARGVRASV